MLLQVNEAHLPEIFKKIERNEKSFREDVEIIRNWLQTQAHLPEIMNDKRIASFLLLNKCSIEKTKQKIDMYYTIRSLIPELYDHFNPKLDKMRQCNQIIYNVPLPKPTHDFARIHFFKVKNPALIDQLDPIHVIGQVYNMFEMRIVQDIYMHDIHVYDLENLPFSYVSKLFAYLPKVITIYEKVFSMRLKNLFLINGSAYLTTVSALLKKLLKPKLFERIIILDSPLDLNKHLPLELLPSEYGGSGPNLDEITELFNAELTKLAERFDQLDKLRVDETKRTKMDDTNVYGNFKKLDFD